MDSEGKFEQEKWMIRRLGEEAKGQNKKEYI